MIWIILAAAYLAMLGILLHVFGGPRRWRTIDSLHDVGRSFSAAMRRKWLGIAKSLTDVRRPRSEVFADASRSSQSRRSWQRRDSVRHGIWFAIASAVIAVGSVGIAVIVESRPIANQVMNGFEFVLPNLRADRLVPPSELSPDRYVIRGYGDVATADRKWAKLDPNFRQAVLRLIKAVEAAGYGLQMIEGYRSPDRQDELLALGMTYASGGRSKHQYGLAVDLAPYHPTRSIVISEKDPWAAKVYEAIGVAAKAIGLKWGGDFKSLRDYGHVEDHRPIP